VRTTAGVVLTVGATAAYKDGHAIRTIGDAGNQDFRHGTRTIPHCLLAIAPEYFTIRVQTQLGESLVAEKIQGSIVSITATGSLVTDITADQLRDAPRDERTQVRCDEHFTQGIFPPDHGEPEMTFLAVLPESGPLQLEIVGDNASLMLGIRVGQRVVVEWV